MQQFCMNHPTKESANICHCCGNYFCNDCLNKHGEYYYCNSDNCYKKYIEDVGRSHPPKTKTSFKIIAVIASIIVTIIAVSSGTNFVSKLFKSSDIDTQLFNIANEMNKRCPIMVDSGTRLDNTTAGSNRTINYNYTMIKYATDEIDINYFESQMRPFILNGIKTNPEMQILRKKKVTFIYNYKDRTGKHLISFKFTPKEYQ